MELRVRQQQCLHGGTLKQSQEKRLLVVCVSLSCSYLLRMRRGPLAEPANNMGTTNPAHTGQSLNSILGGLVP